MIKKSAEYDKKDFDLKKVYSAFKKLSSDFRFITINKEIGKNEIEEIKIYELEEILNIKPAKNVQSITLMTNEEIIIVLINSFSKFTSISINADKKDDILRIKNIIEEELELKEMINN
ncbi:MAG: hypothetical protein ACOCRK_08385 [bacterium]